MGCQRTSALVLSEPRALARSHVRDDRVLLGRRVESGRVQHSQSGGTFVYSLVSAGMSYASSEIHRISDLALSPLFFSFFLLFFLFGCRTLWLIDWLAYSVVLLSSSPSSCSFFAFLWFDSLARTISSMVSSLVLLYLCCCCY